MHTRGLILIFILSYTTLLNAQTQSNSFYSIYGLGVPQSTHLGLTEAMGGSGIALRPEYNLNTKNPAAMGSIERPFTFMLSTGFDVAATRNENKDTDGLSISGGLTHLDMWFRLSNKWTASLGLMPATEVKYRIFSNRYYDPDGSPYQIFYEGSGGVNQFRFAQSFSPFKNFHLGAVGYLYFGSISKTENVNGITSAPQILVETQSALSGFNYELGFQYSLPIGKSSFNIGATYRPEIVLNSIQDYTLNSFAEILEGELDEEETYALPQQFIAGLAWQSPKLRIALDASLEEWSSLNNLGNTQINYQYEDVFGLNVGAEYAFFKYGYDSRLSATYLRAGVGVRNSYLQIDNSNFNIWNFSLGVGLPVTQSRNQLNLTYQYNHQGRISNDLVQEVTHSISFSFSLRDVWFTKRKFN